MTLWSSLRRWLSLPDLPDREDQRVASTLNVVALACVAGAVVWAPAASARIREALASARQSERALDASRRCYQALAENALDPILEATTDGRIPGLDGAATLAALRARRPDLSVVLSSGYGPDVLAQRIAGSARTAMVPKPYRAEDLVAILGGALAA